MEDNDVVIVAAARTPIGTYGGMFREIRAVDLSVPIMQELIKKANIDPAFIDDVAWGCCYQRTYEETNIARVAALRAGIPKETPAFTIQRVCTSSMWAIIAGVQAIRLMDAEVIMAGGVESMSTVPYTIDALRWGARMNHVEIRDAMWDGLTCLGTGIGMGMTAENITELYKIPREEQDEAAYNSHMKAVDAIKKGRFKEEIVPIFVPQPKGTPVLRDTDEHPRADTTIERLSKLPPVFRKDGTVTAGNSSGINDGSAGVIIMSQKKAKEFGIKPLAKIISYSVVGVDPDIMGIGPIPATKKALRKANMNLDAIELIEVNEPFAAVFLAIKKELGLNPSITNVNGGGISLGHPVGATGARLVVTLLYEMMRRNLKKGLATLCGGGGVATAIIIERN